MLHERARRPLAELDIPRTGTVAVVVGPEGGLTDGEVVAFRAAGAQAVRLGAEVLRTSTAGAAALAALSMRTRWSCNSGHPDVYRADRASIHAVRSPSTRQTVRFVTTRRGSRRAADDRALGFRFVSRLPVLPHGRR